MTTAPEPIFTLSPIFALTLGSAQDDRAGPGTEALPDGELAAQRRIDRDVRPGVSDRADRDRLTLVGADGVGSTHVERGLPGPHIDLHSSR